ncbi:hypothetical protein GCM10009818_26440 [Nakamurella flavida]
MSPIGSSSGRYTDSTLRAATTMAKQTCSSRANGSFTWYDMGSCYNNCDTNDLRTFGYRRHIRQDDGATAGARP